MGSSRWWEYYAVRYFVGTVVGALAVVAFNEYAASPLRGQLFPTLSSFKEAGPEHLLVLAGLGLAYCYIASAPVLAAHALRGQLAVASRSGMFWPVFSIAAAFLLIGGSAYWQFNVPLWSLQFWAVVLVAFILSVQVGLFVHSLLGGFSRVSNYYVKLATARADEGKIVQQYVESYRHLREHGNAFAIVLLEICLVMACITAPNVQALTVLLLIWILPASGVWLVGTVLEARLPSLPKQP